MPARRDPISSSLVSIIFSAKPVIFLSVWVTKTAGIYWFSLALLLAMDTIAAVSDKSWGWWGAQIHWTELFLLVYIPFCISSAACCRPTNSHTKDISYSSLHQPSCTKLHRWYSLKVFQTAIFTWPLSNFLLILDSIEPGPGKMCGRVTGNAYISFGDSPVERRIQMFLRPHASDYFITSYKQQNMSQIDAWIIE